MRNKQWGITLLTLVIVVVLLGGGFSIYAKKGLDKSSFAAPDGSRIVKIEKRKDGASFLIEDCDAKGKMQAQMEWPGKLLLVEWTQDASKYAINREEEGCKKIEVEEVETAKIRHINQEVKDGLYEVLKQKHKEEPSEEATLSLTFQSWCDDNESILLKYEVSEQGAVCYTGYLIYYIADEVVGAVYETK